MSKVVISQLTEAERIEKLIGSSCAIRNKPKNKSWNWRSKKGNEQSVLSSKKNK